MPGRPKHSAEERRAERGARAMIELYQRACDRNRQEWWKGYSRGMRDGLAACGYGSFADGTPAKGEATKCAPRGLRPREAPDAGASSRQARGRH